MARMKNDSSWKLFFFWYHSKYYIKGYENYFKNWVPNQPAHVFHFQEETFSYWWSKPMDLKRVISLVDHYIAGTLGKY